MIAQAIQTGYFPMGESFDDPEIWMYSTEVRCLFPIEGIHVSRSLERTLRKGPYQIRFDTAFEEVMRSCVRPTGNWITLDLIRVYTEIHRAGWGHSVECWLNDRLVGGAYGVAIGGLFSAESMFHRETDASKVALWALVNRCRALGFTLFDSQFSNDHTLSLGAYEIPKREYMKQLRAALELETPWSLPGSPTKRRVA